jgi:hypothetical protein
MTLSQAKQEISGFHELTAKFVAAYTCGPETFESLLVQCNIDPKGVEKVMFMGHLIVPSGLTPEGKFYPCSYLEGMVG